jgi:hypothetical protein
MEDLISSGIIGLIDAVQKFDPSKNINFNRRIRLTQVTTTYRIRGYGRLPHEFNGF